MFGGNTALYKNKQGAAGFLEDFQSFWRIFNRMVNPTVTNENVVSVSKLHSILSS